MDDIRESIKELKYYQEKIFRAKKWCKYWLDWHGLHLETVIALRCHFSFEKDFSMQHTYVILTPYWISMPKICFGTPINFRVCQIITGTEIIVGKWHLQVWDRMDSKNMPRNYTTMCFRNSALLGKWKKESHSKQNSWGWQIFWSLRKQTRQCLGPTGQALLYKKGHLDKQFHFVKTIFFLYKVRDYIRQVTFWVAYRGQQWHILTETDGSVPGQPRIVLPILSLWTGG